jgi:perosamine synthetase
MQLFRPNITEDAIKAVSDVLRSGWIGLGPKTAEFEEAFAEYVGARYAVATNAATSALHLAAVLCDIGPGDEVISTPLTFVSTNHVILYQRATPVFADVDPCTCNIDPDSIERLITEKTRAIMCVHYGGYPCDLDRIYNLAGRYHLRVIEDAAHAAGSAYKGKKIGSFGLTTFSFHAVKNLPVGDGGMITTNFFGEYKRLQRLRWLGIDKDTYSRTVADEGKATGYAWQYDVPEVGFKYHMNDITAAIGLEQLKVLDVENARRREIADIYSRGLCHPDIVALPPLSDDRTISAQHLYVIQVRRRDDLIAKLKNNGIAPGVHYIPNNTFPMYRRCTGEVENAMRTFEYLVSLPLHTLLTDDDVQRVIEVINEGW